MDNFINGKWIMENQLSIIHFPLRDSAKMSVDV